jgi:hypothetical protein
MPCSFAGYPFIIADWSVRLNDEVLNMQDNTPRGEQNSSAYISVLRNHRWMGKRFFLDDDGQLQKQANGLFSKGYVKVQNASCAQELATLAQSLTPQDAFCLGQPRGANIFSAAPVATRQTQQALANRSVPILSRTKDDFSFGLGEGWLLLDYDTRGLPEAVSSRIERLGGILNALRYVWPELDNGDFVVRPSSSAGVHVVGEPAPKISGFHMFVRLKRAADIPQALKALHSRCWLHGLGYHMISKSGQLLDRSIVDITVGSPERLIFTAPPLLGEGIARERQYAAVQQGVALACPPAPFGAQWSRARDIDRQSSQPDAATQRSIYLHKSIEDRQASHGGSYAAAEAIVLNRIEGRQLLDDDVLQLSSGATANVGDILNQIKLGERISCADPIEGREYNPTAAAVLWEPPHKFPALISHAHGELTRYGFARFSPAKAKSVEAAL